MGQNISTLLAHPLTGTAIQILINWISSLPSIREKVIGEQLLLQKLNELGYDPSHMKAIMPGQENFIDRINELETALQLEQRLSSQYREAYNAVKRESDQQLQQNLEIEKYFRATPNTEVKMPEEYKNKAILEAEKNNVDRNNFYNFAFVGHTNNGKSRLINAILGLKMNDEGSAAVSIFETTQNIKFYSYKGMPNVRFYDIPGAGSMTHRSKTYYEDKALCGFDCLIILVQQALMEEEIEFAKAALKYDQKVVFVRSKCDLDFHLTNEGGINLDSLPSAEAVQNHIEDLRSQFNREVEKHAPELSTIECFFVSAKSMYAMIRTEKAEMVFEETKFLEYLHQQSKTARGF